MDTGKVVGGGIKEGSKADNSVALHILTVTSYVPGLVGSILCETPGVFSHCVDEATELNTRVVT